MFQTGKAFEMYSQMQFRRLPLTDPLNRNPFTQRLLTPPTPVSVCRACPTAEVSESERAGERQTECKVAARCHENDTRRVCGRSEPLQSAPRHLSDIPSVRISATGVVRHAAAQPWQRPRSAGHGLTPPPGAP